VSPPKLTLIRLKEVEDGLSCNIILLFVFLYVRSNFR